MTIFAEILRCLPCGTIETIHLDEKLSAELEEVLIAERIWFHRKDHAAPASRAAREFHAVRQVSNARSCSGAAPTAGHSIAIRIMRSA